MKRKVEISLLLTLLMVFSTFAVVGSSEKIEEECPMGCVDFDKKVFDGEGWVESIEVETDDVVRFNLSVTYHKHPDNQDPWELYRIKIKDKLPDCLNYADDVSVFTTGSSEIEYIEEVSGKWIYWNFSDYKPTLKDGESLYLEFNATVLESDPGEYENWAHIYGKENCQYHHNEEDTAKVVVIECGEPGIAIDKKVKDPITEEWVDDEIIDYICIYDLLNEGQYIEFQINVSNTGEISLSNVLVEDILPEFLKFRSSDVSPDYVSSNGQEIIWDLGTITTGEAYSVITFSAWIYPNYFIFNDMAEGENYANATSDQTDMVEDSVNVIIHKRLSFEKEVWDGEEWIKELNNIRLGQNVKFRITAKYHGPEGSLMDCMLAGDLLPNDCLEYKETTLVKVAGNELEPGTYEYPDIIPDNGDTILICGEEVEIPELIEIPCGNYYVILWDFRESWSFELHDGEEIIIEFDANVTNYCDCVSTNYAFGIGWGCYVCDPCNYYLDWDYAKVNCSAPKPRFDKKVLFEDEWVDEGIGVLGEEMEFKLEYEYYGNDVLMDVRFKDELPCVLEFSEVVESNINITVEVSKNKKIVWFNMSEDSISDGDIVIIRFTAMVTGITGGCCPEEAINKAWLFIYGCPGQIIDTEYDEVSLKTHHKPCKPIISGDEFGNTGEELSFSVAGDDPDLDEVYYKICWGDGTTSDWLGPFESGESTGATHIWEGSGEYTVKAKAKDEHGAESDWGNEITVKISGEPAFNAKIKKGIGRKIQFNIINNGESDVNDIDWKISVKKKGLLGRNLLSDNDTIEILESGSTDSISRTTKRGIGRISICLTVNASGMDEINKCASGFIIGKFVFVMS